MLGYGPGGGFGLIGLVLAWGITSERRWLRIASIILLIAGAGGMVYLVLTEEMEPPMLIIPVFFVLLGFYANDVYRMFSPKKREDL